MEASVERVLVDDVHPAVLGPDHVEGLRTRVRRQRQCQRHRAADLAPDQFDEILAVGDRLAKEQDLEELRGLLTEQVKRQKRGHLRLVEDE